MTEKCGMKAWSMDWNVITVRMVITWMKLLICRLNLCYDVIIAFIYNLTRRKWRRLQWRFSWADFPLCACRRRRRAGPRLCPPPTWEMIDERPPSRSRSSSSLTSHTKVQMVNHNWKSKDGDDLLEICKPKRCNKLRTERKFPFKEFTRFIKSK